MNINISLIWEEARLQIGDMLRKVANEFDLADIVNVREKATITTTGLPGVDEYSIMHGYNGIPEGYIIAGQTAPGNLYKSNDSDFTYMYFKSDAVAGTKFDIIIF